MSTRQGGPADVVESVPTRSRLTPRGRALVAAFAVVGLVGLVLLFVRETDPPVPPRPVARHTPAPPTGLWRAAWWPVAAELGTPAARAWRATGVTGDSDIGVLYAARLPGGPDVAVLAGVEPSGNQVALLARRADGWTRLRTWHVPLTVPDTFTFLVPDTASGQMNGPGHLLVLARGATTATVTTASPGHASVTEQTLPLEHDALVVAVGDLSTVTRVVVRNAGHLVADVTPGDPAGAPRPPHAPASFIVASGDLGDSVAQVRTDGRRTVCLTFEFALPGPYPDSWHCRNVEYAPGELLSERGVVYGCGPADARAVRLTRPGHAPVLVPTVRGASWTLSCYAWFGDETTVSAATW